MDEGEDVGTIGATQMELNVSTQDLQSVFTDEMNVEDAEGVDETMEEEKQQADAKDVSSNDKPLRTADPPASEGAALFGDDEEEEEDNSPEPVESMSGGTRAPPPGRDPRRANAARARVQEIGAIAEDGVDDDIVRIPLTSSGGQPNATDTLTLVGLPSSVRLDPDVFNVVRYREYEKELVSSQKVNELRDLQKELTGEVIRTKLKGNVPPDYEIELVEETISAPGGGGEVTKLQLPRNPQDLIDKVQSTCKYVEFSDGTSAVLIGQNVYGQIGISDFNAVLLDVSQVPVLRAQGDLTSRRIYSIATRKFMS